MQLVCVLTSSSPPGYRENGSWVTPLPSLAPGNLCLGQLGRVPSREQESGCLFLSCFSRRKLGTLCSRLGGGRGRENDSQSLNMTVFANRGPPGVLLPAHWVPALKCDKFIVISIISTIISL